MHRDIKPGNILVDPEKNELFLIDWGLAEFYIPGKEYNVRVSTMQYKSPDLLMNYKYTDYTTDVW